MESTVFAFNLLGAFRTALGDECTELQDEDIATLQRFALSPEFAEARAAAQRLRDLGIDKHPFVNNAIVSALEEFGSLMFNKTKARLRKFEETHNNVHAAAQHVRDNQMAYTIAATGVSCLLVGGLGGAALGKVDTKQTVDSFKFIHLQWKSPNVNIAMVKQACPDPIPIIDKSTGIPYPSINKAAKLTDAAYAVIRNDVHGAQDRFARLPDSVFA